MELAQLQSDALAQAAGAHAGGLERLHGLQHALHIRGGGLDLRQQALADFLERILEVPVVGDCICDDARDRHVDRGQFGEFQLLYELFLQGLTVLVAEIAAAIIVSRPGGIRRTARLFAPCLVRDLHFRLFALIARGAVAVEFSVLFLGRRFIESALVAAHLVAHLAAHGVAGYFQRALQGLLVGLEHDIGLEGLAYMSLKVERGELQQPYRLLQLRRHGELLADAKLQTWLQHISIRSKPTV